MSRRPAIATALQDRAGEAITSPVADPKSRRTVALVGPHGQVTEEGLRDAPGGIPAGIELFSCAEAPSADRLGEIEGLISNAWLPEPGQMPRLRWVQTLNAGHENLPDALVSAPGVEVCHGSGPAAVPIAEWTLGAMLFFAHRFRRILIHERGRSWHKNRQAEMSASVLHGTTVGIVGYGAIGRQVGRLCHMLGMRVMATLGRAGKRQQLTYRTPGTGDPDGELPDRWVGFAELHDALADLDFIVLALRLDERTAWLVDDAFLSRCKPQAVLVNMARGGLVDELALARALAAGRIGGAALDVFNIEPLPADDPLRDVPNVLLSPHCSPESPFFQTEIRNMVAENLRRFAAGEPLLNVIRPHTRADMAGPT